VRRVSAVDAGDQETSCCGGIVAYQKVRPPDWLYIVGSTASGGHIVGCLGEVINIQRMFSNYLRADSKGRDIWVPVQDEGIG
jgi:hypothetical protein